MGHRIFVSGWKIGLATLGLVSYLLVGIEVLSIRLPETRLPIRPNSASAEHLMAAPRPSGSQQDAPAMISPKASVSSAPLPPPPPPRARGGGSDRKFLHVPGF